MDMIQGLCTIVYKLIPKTLSVHFVHVIVTYKMERLVKMTCENTSTEMVPQEGICTFSIRCSKVKKYNFSEVWHEVYVSIFD